MVNEYWPISSYLAYLAKKYCIPILVVGSVGIQTAAPTGGSVFVHCLKQTLCVCATGGWDVVRELAART